MTYVWWMLPLVAFAGAWVMTSWLFGYAVRRRMVDVPGERSSHHVTTPRGGGGGIVVATSVVLVWVAWTGGVAAMPIGVLAAGLLVAAIGFIDDHGHVAPGLRLAGHFVAAGVAVWSLGGAPPMPMWGTLVSLGWLGDGLAVIFVVWLLNLTNFMDGIDGIAATQVVTVCAAGAALFAVTVPGDARWLEPLVLAAATAGFLLWNWPPARIFMGDVGSGYLGFMVAALTLRAAWASPVLGWCWLVLSGVFIADATTTLARRALRRARLSQAHRSHAYQHLALAWGSHQRVTLLVLAINVLGLAPLAWMVAAGWIEGTTGVVLAYVPLVFGAVRLGAGRP